MELVINIDKGLKTTMPKPSAPKDVERWSTPGVKQTPNKDSDKYETAKNNTEAEPTENQSNGKESKLSIFISIYKEAIRKQFESNDYSMFTMISTDNKPNNDASYEPNYPPTSLKDMNMSLQEEEVSYRCGDIGLLDLDLLIDGDIPDDEMFKLSQKALDLQNVKDSPDTYFRSIFRGCSKEGLEGVFISDKFYSQLTGIHISPNSNLQVIGCELTFTLFDKSDKKIGYIIRYLYRDEQGLLHVSKTMTSLIEGNEKLVDARNLCNREAQLYRYLSMGFPVSLVQVTGSKGIFSLPLTGYDFATKELLDNYIKGLTDFCSGEENISLEKALEKGKYESILDIKHAFELSCLNDGKLHKLQLLGKYFMHSMSKPYAAILLLNAETDGETLYKHYIDLEEKEV